MTFIDKWFERCSLCEGVVFDFGGVISIAPTREDYTVVKTCEGLGLSQEAFYKGWDDYRHLWDGGFISAHEMYRRIFADSGMTLDEATLEKLYREDAFAWVKTLAPVTLDLMARLKNAGKKIGILTNMSDEFYRDFFAPRAAQYLAYADAVVVSGQHKMYKPERPIYDLMVEKIGIEPAKLIFLDDTQKNVDAAIRYGWQSELYRAADAY